MLKYEFLEKLFNLLKWHSQKLSSKKGAAEKGGKNVVYPKCRAEGRECQAMKLERQGTD